MIIPVIFEDENILVIDKPSGVVVHPFDFSDEETVVDFLHAHSPVMFSINNSITLQDERIIPLGGIVHKLDRETSGVMIIAKNEPTFKALKKEFLNHATTKKYIALVEGVVEKENYTIDAPLGRNKKEYKQSVSPINPRGELRSAITEVNVLQKNSNTTLVELAPLTGRTHQLRAHMSHDGHPIVGDVAYGSTVKDSRIMLHAYSLSFILNGEEKTFTAETPAEFK